MSNSNTPALSRAGSRSSLWRSWSPMLEDLVNYEKSRENYPWLIRDHDRDISYDSNRSSRPRPMASLAEDPDVASQSDQSAKSSEDLERRPVPEPLLLPQDEDPNLVTWDGPHDPSNPHNWTKRKKWLSTILVSCFTFISPVSSTMLAPALPDLAKEFKISSDFETYLLMSIFLLAYAIGPFLLAPLSEMFGRVVVLQSANMFYLIFNTVCGFSKTREQMLIFRFLSGLGGSAPQALGGGVLSDCWQKEERGTATAIYSLAPFLGPAVGPIAAGYLTQHLNWRWIFWVVSIADAAVQILAFLFLQETYPPKILKVKARKLRKITGNGLLHTEFEQRDRSFVSLLLTNLKRPFKMLFTQPAIQITALYRAYLYGLMYLVFASFPMVWEQQYNQEPGRASLNYVSLGIGFVIGLQVSGPLIDKVYAMLKTRYKHPGRPEFRVPLMFPTALVTPAGLVLYGVSAHLKLHWIIPNVGTAVFSAGLILSFQCAQTYIIDSYERYAASATGAAAFVRTMAGFSFPLFAPAMYKRLGIACCTEKTSNGLHAKHPHASLTDARLQTRASSLLVTHVNKVELDDELVSIYQYVLTDLTHTVMLTHTGIFDAHHGQNMFKTLLSLRAVDTASMLASNIENYPEHELGPRGREIQRARSRIDQKATNWRLINHASLTEVIQGLVALSSQILVTAERHAGALMPGYTHLQDSQPTTIDHYLNAHYRAVSRNLPLGGAAYSGTSWPIDRTATAHYLGFNRPVYNARDAGFAALDMGAELAVVLAATLSGISRLASDLNYWSSSEVGLVWSMRDW
ncbi:hypothetical protein LZL87_013205 [Fusarium oxysporum]|nr:hypothetical protein LZL87_013205 [Fusarium oxysporum]